MIRPTSARFIPHFQPRIRSQHRMDLFLAHAACPRMHTRAHIGIMRRDCKAMTGNKNGVGWFYRRSCLSAGTSGASHRHEPLSQAMQGDAMSRNPPLHSVAFSDQDWMFDGIQRTSHLVHVRVHPQRALGLGRDDMASEQSASAPSAPGSEIQ